MPLPSDIQVSPKHVAVTKSDVTTYDPPLRAVYVGGAGDLALADQFGNVVTYVGRPAGSQIEGIFTKVMSTNTTATLIIGRY